MHFPLIKRWQIAPEISPEAEEALGAYPPILRQLLYNRSIHTAAEAEVFFSSQPACYDPFLMTGMGEVVERLEWALQKRQPIAVYGDFDVDGVTASSLMVQALRRLGGEVRVYIPNRFEEGYGLNKEALSQLKAQGVELVLTVDCGIRSPGEAEHARRIGLDLMISDHHEPKDGLPDCRAVICPKQAGDLYPEKNLAGVGLAYKIVSALLQKMAVEDVHAEEWLDLVAVGTVADVVPLTGENRCLVTAGLEALRHWQRDGLRALAGVAGIALEKVSARDIGFAIGPRLNAAGRLDTALDSFLLLMSDDANTLGLMAQKLDDQNRRRQELTRLVQEKVEEMAVDRPTDRLIFAVQPEFEMGVVGLAAARLTETYYRPAIVGSRGEEYTRASCRSIPEFHITHALDECSDLFERHGGHAMAAGFTVHNDRLDELESRLGEIAARELLDYDLYPVLTADLEIPLHELRPEILSYIDRIEPTGQDNPEVLFVSRDLHVVRSRAVGSDSKHLRLTVTDGKITYDAIAFRLGAWAAQMPEQVDLIYSYERNQYQGRETLQLNVRDLRPAADA